MCRLSTNQHFCFYFSPLCKNWGRCIPDIPSDIPVESVEPVKCLLNYIKLDLLYTRIKRAESDFLGVTFEFSQAKSLCTRVTKRSISFSTCHFGYFWLFCPECLMWKCVRSGEECRNEKRKKQRNNEFTSSCLTWTSVDTSPERERKMECVRYQRQDFVWFVCVAVGGGSVQLNRVSFPLWMAAMTLSHP